MKHILMTLFLSLAVQVSLPATAADGPAALTLLSSGIDGVDGKEVVVSRVDIPPNTALPKHWHPGEEFAYVLAGRVQLWQKGKEDSFGGEGELMMIPARQIHTGITGEEGVSLLIFRVHDEGQPERVLAE